MLVKYINEMSMYILHEGNKIKWKVFSVTGVLRFLRAFPSFNCKWILK